MSAAASMEAANKDITGKSRVDLIPWREISASWPLSEGALPKYWMHLLAWIDTTQDLAGIATAILEVRNKGATWEGVGHVLAFGAAKYGENNWRKGGILKHVLAAAQRHILAIAEKGERINEESGLPHIDHALCNLMFAFVYVSADTK